MELHIHEDGFVSAQIGVEETKLMIHVDKRINASLLLTYGGGRELTSEITVAEGASFTLVMKHEGIQEVTLRQESKVMKDARLQLAYCELDAGDTDIHSVICLKEEGASTFVRSATIASHKKHFHIVCEHQTAHTTGEMENYAVVHDGGKYRMEAIGQIVKGAKGSASHQTTRVLTMSERHCSEVLPVLRIDENDVKASHATSVGQPDENQLYYLQTRGLSRKMAMGLLTVGYLMPITELLVDETLKKDLQNEIETKVGLHV